MTASEEQNFFIEVASDREMRTELKAYQVVESAVRKDREVDAASYADLRSHMMGVLQASSQAGSGGSQAAGEPASQAGSSLSAGKFPSWASSGILPMKIMLSVGAGAIITVGAMLLGPWNSDAPKDDAAVPATVRTSDTMPSSTYINNAAGPLVPAVDSTAQQAPMIWQDTGAVRTLNESDTVKTRKARQRLEEKNPPKNNAESARAEKTTNTSTPPVVPHASVPATVPRDTPAKNPEIRVLMRVPKNDNR